MRYVMLLSLCVLAACSSVPDYDVVLPYRLQVQSFTDTRPEESKLMVEEPFQTAPFIEAIHKAFPSPPFGAVPAVMDLTLVEYNATRHGDDFALSLVMDYVVTGRKQTLAQGQVTCAEVWTEQFDLHHLALNLPNIEEFTKAGMRARIWGDIRDACVESIATTMTNDLIQRKGAF